MPLDAGIYYYAARTNNGEMPPLVLIHGAGGTHLHWPPQVRRLPVARVYALDLPGHGKSEGRGYQTIEDYCQSILRWMQSLNLAQAIFSGHSMGGAISHWMEVHHPEHVIALGLVGTGARLRVAPAILENTAAPTTFPAAVDTVIQWAFSPHTDPHLVDLAAKQMGKTRPAVMHGDFLACNEFDVMPDLSKIRVPALVIVGQDDKLTPVRYAQHLAAQLPRAELKIIPEAGHMVMLEQPRAVASALAEFVEHIHYMPGRG
jgi:pimeloyl-ACP methyl ester carboxylesterase